MAYTPTVWKDHIVQRPRTYTVTDNSDGTKTFADAPGQVIQEGTPMDAENFNKLENGLADASGQLDELSERVEEIVDGSEETIASLDEKKLNVGGNVSPNQLTSAVPVTKGGTGATTPEGARANLSAAAAVHQHSATDITSGTLPVERGGTGQTSRAGVMTSHAGTPAGVTLANLAATTNTLAAFGLTEDVTTDYILVNKMANNTSITFTYRNTRVDGGFILTDAPFTFGTITLFRGLGLAFCSGYGTSVSGEVYEYKYSNESTASSTNGWKKSSLDGHTHEATTDITGVLTLEHGGTGNSTRTGVLRSYCRTANSVTPTNLCGNVQSLTELGITEDVTTDWIISNCMQNNTSITFTLRNDRQDGGGHIITDFPEASKYAVVTLNRGLGTGFCSGFAVTINGNIYAYKYTTVQMDAGTNGWYKLSATKV